MKLIVFFLGWLSTVSLFAQQGSSPALAGHSQPEQVVATYSIVAWDSVTGDLGVAVQSKFLGVGAVVPFAKAGVGAIATQAWANTMYGPQGLSMLESGQSAQEVVQALTISDSNATRRQVGIVDAHGNSFAYTGSACQPWAGHVMGKWYSVQGNILAGEGVVKGMARMFEITPGDLAERLLASVEAGEAAGGDKRGRQSAALLVVRDKGGYSGYNDRFVDIRVDDNLQPLVELRRIYDLWTQTFLLDARFQSIEQFNKNRNFSAASEEMKRVVAALNMQVRKKPDDPEVLNNVAWTMATHDIDLSQALELAKRAVKLAPEKLSFLDTMAECHFRLGHYDEAIAIEAGLVTKDASNDEYWKQLQKFKEAKTKAGK